MIIYKITNIINNKLYIGQTIQPLKRRWADHKTKGSILYNSIKKYGLHNFVIEQIDSAITQEELNNKEIYWIKQLNTIRPSGYNIRLGGNSGGKLNESTKEKLRIINTGKKQSEETKLKIGKAVSGQNNGMYGKTISKEASIKRLESMQKHYEDPEYIESFTKHLKTYEHRQKMLNGYKDFQKTEEYQIYIENSRKRLLALNQSRDSKLKRAKSKGGKPFICNETGEIFELLQDAADKFNVDKRQIHSVLKYPKRYKTIKRKYTFKYIEKR